MGIKIDSVIRSRRRTISLEVTPEAKLIIRAPLFEPASHIRDAVDKRAAWIAEKQRLAMSRSLKYPPESYTEGGTFWYLGESYELEFRPGPGEPYLRDGVLSLPESQREKAREALTGWYRRQALSVITQRVEFYSGLTGLKYSSVGVTGARTRWGSCGPRNTLNFSWRLVMAPPGVIDYVVVHELSHTRHHDHSKAFWDKVEKIMPGYGAKKQWLAENSGLLR